MAFDQSAYQKKREAWKTRKSLKWWPELHRSRRRIQQLRSKAGRKSKKGGDIYDELYELGRALNFMIDAIILQMDETDDRLKELEDFVINNSNLQLSQKDMDAIVNKISRLR